MNRIYILHKSVPFTEKRLRKLDTGLKGGFEEMEHQFQIGIFCPDIQDVTFSDVPLLPEIFLWNDQKSRVPFTSQPDFPETFCKQPLLVLERFSIFNYSTLRDGKMNKNRQLEVENTVRFFFRSLQNTNTISGLQEQKYLE